MNPSPQNSGSQGQGAASTASLSRLVLIGALVVGVVSGAALLMFTGNPGRQTAAGPASPSVNPPDSPGTTLATQVPAEQAPPGPSAAAGVERASHAAPGPVPEPTPYSRQLVVALCLLDASGSELSQEQVAQWKENLQQLV